MPRTSEATVRAASPMKASPSRKSPRKGKAGKAGKPPMKDREVFGNGTSYEGWWRWVDGAYLSDGFGRQVTAASDGGWIYTGGYRENERHGFGDICFPQALTYLGRDLAPGTRAAGFWEGDKLTGLVWVFEPGKPARLERASGGKLVDDTCHTVGADTPLAAALATACAQLASQGLSPAGREDAERHEAVARRLCEAALQLAQELETEEGDVALLTRVNKDMKRLGRAEFFAAAAASSARIEERVQLILDGGFGANCAPERFAAALVRQVEAELKRKELACYGGLIRGIAREHARLGERIAFMSDSELGSVEMRAETHALKRQAISDCLGQLQEDADLWVPQPRGEYLCEDCGVETECKIKVTQTTHRKEDQSEEPKITVLCVACKKVWKADADAGNSCG